MFLKCWQVSEGSTAGGLLPKATGLGAFRLERGEAALFSIHYCWLILLFALVESIMD